MDTDGGAQRGGRRRGRRARRAAPAGHVDAADDEVAVGSPPGEEPAPAAGGHPEPSGTGRPPVDHASSLVGFQQLLDQSPLGALVVDADARVVLHNDRAAALLGTHHEDLVNGRFQHPLTAEGYDVVRRDADGVARTLHVDCAPFEGFETAAWTVSITDRTTATPAPDPGDQRFGSSTHDPLTGLPGRELLLNHVFETARRSRSLDEDRFAVVVVDLERFERVNGAHGRTAGDRVLQAVAARLTSTVRPGDYVSRSGGDEFAVVLPPQPTAAHLAVTDRIHEVLSQPVVLDGAEIFCSPVIGVAEHVEDDDEHSVLARAEAAMVARSPGATHLAPRPEVGDATRHGSVGPNVTRAVSEGQMFLHYQPVFALADSSVVALEALVRWEHPDDGLIAPDEFIRIAEEHGGIIPLGEWVIAEVCEQIAAWRTDQTDYLVPPVHVNVSARQLATAELRRHALGQLTRHGLAPEVLRFEITEDVLLDHDPRVEALLADLAEDGIGLVLDEFGTGLSSLTHLRRAPLAGVKIDRSFVARLMTDEASAQLVLATIDAARAFDLPVTAIGVETAEQKAVLDRWGCDHAQGYLLARPVTPVEASRFFARDPDSLRVRPSGPLLRSSGAFDRPIARPAV